VARQNSRTQRAQGGAKTWDVPRRRADVSIPDGVSDASGRLHETMSAWAVAEVAPGRLKPWLPVAFGLGIAVYFTADREPALWTASALAFAATVVAVLTRQRAIAFPLALGLAAMGLGLAAPHCTPRGSLIRSCSARYWPAAGLAGRAAAVTPFAVKEWLAAGADNTEGRQPEYGCDLRCDRLYRAAGGRTSCVDGAGGRGLCRGLRTCGRGGERPRGTIIELCGNAGRSRGLAHAWRHRIALERPTLRARRYTSIGLPTSVDTCDGERCGGRAGANQPAPRDASPRSEFLEADD
jgi:hypothetical protein